MTKMTTFRQFVLATGRNLKQIAETGALIGLPLRRSIDLSAGRRELSPAELLAMSAHRAGLKPWTPEYDQELQRIARYVARPVEDGRLKRAASGSTGP